MKKNQREPSSRERLRKLSVVISARDEQDYIASTVEHLHLELRLNGIDHEIIVVDDGSTDNTWRVLGSRFIHGGGAIDYPVHKLILNRAANLFLRILFHSGLNDTTNAFKAYRRNAIEGCRPFLSPHFNLTVELPLKTIVRGYSWTVIPITWRNRRRGLSKLQIKEMGSRYLFIALYCWLERYFSRGDYKKELAKTDVADVAKSATGSGPRL